ncbi:MAG: ABC transporter permease [Clostridiales bacterium]|jgi:oligopeptide transport system permease protein|nr:ABC transporter permease [Clostridiales bacterium]
MLKYVSIRVISAVVTLFIVITATFFLMFLVPGGPFLSERVNQQTIDLMNRKYGLDKPLYVQYGNYLKNMLKGDLGVSYKRRGYTITEIILEKFPVSARMGGLAILTALIISVPLGILAAYKRNTPVDRVIMIISTFGMSLPSFIISVTLLYILGMWLKVLPTIGLQTPQNYIMPVIALALNPTCYIIRLMRSSMLDIQGQDYLKTARAKGLPEILVLFKHALKNAVIPVITYLGPMTTAVLTGSFVIEKIFSIPGLGKYFIDSISGRDYPMIMGTTIFFAAILIAANLIVDILYSVMDPRIQY